MSESKKPHLIRVSVTSISEGVENQVVLIEEGALTAPELTTKCFTIVDHVVPAVSAAMKELAKAGGFPTGVGDTEPKPKPKIKR